MKDLVVTQTRQIGIKADSHEEAIKAVLDGAGDTLGINMTVTERPQPPQSVIGPGAPTGGPILAPGGRPPAVPQAK